MVAKKRAAKKRGPTAAGKLRQAAAVAESRAASRAKSNANLKGTKPPEFKPTVLEKRQVMVMKSMGWQNDKLCRIVRGGIDVKTLVKHFPTELAHGAEMVEGAIDSKMYERAAIDGDVGALKWWQASRHGWRDKDADTNPFAGATINIHKDGKKAKPKQVTTTKPPIEVKMKKKAAAKKKVSR